MTPIVELCEKILAWRPPDGVTRAFYFDPQDRGITVVLQFQGAVSKGDFRVDASREQVEHILNHQLYHVYNLFDRHAFSLDIPFELEFGGHRD